MQRLILVRHGQTDHNIERRLQGQIDISLNSVGEQQAHTLAESLASLGEIAAIYSSPLSRAHATAQALALPHGLRVHTDERLLERGFGEWEGLTREEIQERWPEQFAQWVGGHPVSGARVESRKAVAERMNRAMHEYHRSHPDGDVIIVSHGAAISLAITAALGLDTEQFRGLIGINNCHRAILVPQGSGIEKGWMRLASLNIAPDFPAGE